MNPTGEVATSASADSSDAPGRSSRALRVAQRANGLEAITAAARDVFVERGYHGASIRDIAARAGVSLSALYYWHASKQDLLAALVAESREDYLHACRAQLAVVPDDDPVGQLTALVSATVRYRVRRQAESELSAREWRHLEGPHQAELEGLRTAAGRLWDAVIERGVRLEVFTCDFPDDSRRTIQAACNAISQWYDATGPVDVEELVERYVAIALRVVQPVPRGAER